MNMFWEVQHHLHFSCRTKFSSVCFITLTCKFAQHTCPLVLSKIVFDSLLFLGVDYWSQSAILLGLFHFHYAINILGHILILIWSKVPYATLRKGIRDGLVQMTHLPRPHIRPLHPINFLSNVSRVLYPLVSFLETQFFLLANFLVLHSISFCVFSYFVICFEKSLLSRVMNEFKFI